MRMKISLLGKKTYFGFQSMWTQTSLIMIISRLGDRPLSLILHTKERMDYLLSLNEFIIATLTSADLWQFTGWDHEPFLESASLQKSQLKAIGRWVNRYSHTVKCTIFFLKLIYSRKLLKWINNCVLKTRIFYYVKVYNTVLFHGSPIPTTTKKSRREKFTQAIGILMGLLKYRQS